MRAALLVLLVVLAAAPLAAGNSVSGQRLTGAAVFQEWHLYSFWVNTTGPQDLRVDWRASPTFPAEDLSITIYKPGTFDRECPPDRDCVFTPAPSDTYAVSAGCVPSDGREGGTLAPGMPLGKYDVFVEGNVGVDVPYTISSASGDVRFRLGMTGAIAVFIPPC